MLISQGIHLMWLDYLILVLLMTSTVLSVVRGFVKEAISLCSWVLAIWLALKGAEAASVWFESMISIMQVRWFAAFLTIFSVVLFIGSLLNYILSQMVKRTLLKNVDHVLGLFFGFARGVLVVTVAVFALGYTEIPKESDWNASYLLPKFTVLAAWAKENMPEPLKVKLGFLELPPHKAI